jgi:hypothetical protein
MVQPSFGGHPTHVRIPGAVLGPHTSAAGEPADSARTADAEQHNSRIGSRLQRSVQQLLLIVGGVPIYLMLRLLLRLEVRGAERLDGLDGPVIFAARHFYELDPAIAFYGGGVWLRVLHRPYLVAASIAGPWWFETPMRRAFSWLLGALILDRGGAPADTLRHAERLLTRSRAVSVAIYPTGPIGRNAVYVVKPGVGELALRAPDVPVMPVSLAGVQQLRWRDVIRLRRPRVRIAFCQPFTARQVAAYCGTTDDEALIDDVRDRVAAAWRAHE